MEVCRIVDEFASCETFDLFPESGQETWIGRWYDCPHSSSEVATPSPFLILRLRIGSFDLGPDALRLLPINGVLPYSVRSLMLTKTPSQQELQSYGGLVEALSGGRSPPSPQLAQQLKTTTRIATGRGRMTEPSAVAQTQGVSTQFFDIAGQDPRVRKAGDGRMLMVAGSSAFELWKIP